MGDQQTRSDRAAGNWWAVQQHTEGTEQRPLAFSTLSLTLPSTPSLHNAHSLCVSFCCRPQTPPFFFRPYLFSSASLLLSYMRSFVSPFRLACVLFSNPFFFFFSFFFLVLTHMTCLSFPTALFSSSYLPLSLPRLPCVSPLDCHVRCCCAVDKTQSPSHPSCTWDLWLLLCRQREHVRKTVGGRQTRKEAKRRKKMQNAIHPPKLEPGGQLNVLELFVTV